MNHNKYGIRGITLLLVMLIAAGCASQKTEPDPTSAILSCPTNAPLSCPTNAPSSCPTNGPLSCPTTAAQQPPEIDAFRANLSTMPNVVFTFDPGDKCSMQIRSKPFTSPFIYEIVVNDQAHLNYMLYGGTLDPGHTIAEVQEYNRLHPNTKDPPPMMTMQLYQAVNPMSKTWNLVNYTGDPIVFSCLTEGPDAHQVIASFDPLVMPTK